jgi:alpha-L-fucosidase
MKIKSLRLSILLFIMTVSWSCEYETKTNKESPVDYLNESKENFDQRMNWFREARFGMFIHWGVYAIPAGIHKGEKVKGVGEWIQLFGQIPIEEYEKYGKQFNPTKYDAMQWAKAMKKAGMKYVVITSKHHDGFALWDSEVSNYDIIDFAPYGKDILKSLAEACKAEGIKFGLYHSIMDWHHPQAQAIDAPRYKYQKNPNPEFPQYYENYLKPQLKELVDNYDPDIMWFDGEWIPDFTHEMGLDLYQYVRTLKPSIIINNRVDKGRKGMAGMNRDDKKYAGDFGTPEQEVLEGTSTMDWESCMTMNDSWGYKSFDDNWKSSEVLIHNLIDIAAKGGNYLLNIGPKANGEIPTPSIERLEKMGEWLAINGEAIYATQKLEKTYKQGENIRFTKKKDKPHYYAITLEQPEKELVIKHIQPQENSNIILLGHPGELDWSFDQNKGLIIQIPKNISGELAWTFKIEGTEI